MKITLYEASNDVHVYTPTLRVLYTYQVCVLNFTCTGTVHVVHTIRCVHVHVNIHSCVEGSNYTCITVHVLVCILCAHVCVQLHVPVLVPSTMIVEY